MGIMVDELTGFEWVIRVAVSDSHPDNAINNFGRGYLPFCEIEIFTCLVGNRIAR